MSSLWETRGRQVPPAAQRDPPQPRATEERQAILAQVLQRELAGGGRIESQTATSAVIVRGRRVNHILHLLISIFTIGLWVIVWLLLALSGGEKRTMITVDEYGNVSSRPV